MRRAGRVGEMTSVLEFPVGHLDGTSQEQMLNIEVWGLTERSDVKVKCGDPRAYRRWRKAVRMNDRDTVKSPSMRK